MTSSSSTTTSQRLRVTLSPPTTIASWRNSIKSMPKPTDGRIPYPEASPASGITDIQFIESDQWSASSTACFKFWFGEHDSVSEAWRALETGLVPHFPEETPVKLSFGLEQLVDDQKYRAVVRIGVHDMLPVLKRMPHFSACVSTSFETKLKKVSIIFGVMDLATKAARPVTGNRMQFIRRARYEAAVAEARAAASSRCGNSPEATVFDSLFAEAAAVSSVPTM